MTIFFALVGAAMAGIGASLQKFGIAARFPRITLREFTRQWRLVARTLLTNKVWLLGLLMGASSGFFMAQAMSGGDLSLVQILSNTTGLWSVLIGVVFFTEKLTGGEWIGLAVMFAGAALVSLTPETTAVGNPNEPLLVGIAAAVGVLMTIALVVNKRIRRGLAAEFLLAANSGLSFGLFNIFMKLTTWQVNAQLGSFNVVSAASWGQMLSILPFWVMLACIVPAFLFMQAAFAHGRVAVITPLVTVFTTFITITCAVIVFHETLSPLRLSGIVASVAGTLVLAQQSRRPAHHLAE